MGGTFETSADQARFHLKPLRVPIRPDAVYEEARNMVADLSGWSIVSLDDARRVITCRRERGFLAGAAQVVITCDGPADIPSTTVHVRSVSSGGLVSRDKANVLAFTIPFHRRLC